MSATAKLLIAVGILVLLGLGLCGIDQLIPSSRTAEFGGAASFFGFILCLLAILVFVVGVIGIVARNLLSRPKQKP